MTSAALPAPTLDDLRSADWLTRATALRSCSFRPEDRALLTDIAQKDPDDCVRTRATEALLALFYQEDRSSSWHSSEPLTAQLGRIMREFSRCRTSGPRQTRTPPHPTPRSELNEERKIVGAMLSHDPLMPLTSDERSCLRYILRGSTRRHIYRHLGALDDFISSPADLD